ncbi:MAG: OstA-like protein, partial [Phycisphaerales bacterium]|nr:OstA-like protein [Phycisphaerales bacterium]
SAATSPAPTEIADMNAGAISTGPTTRPSATQPTTQRSQAPLVVRWTGKLTMYPSEPGQRPRLAPGDAAIELTGSPVVLRRTPAGQAEGNDVLCASLVYHTADGSATLRGSDAAPQVVLGKLVNGKKDPLSSVTTSTLEYVAGKSATLTGRGHATVPVDAAAPAKGVMDAKWARSAKLYFAGRGGPDEMAIEHMDLAGDVDVLHPQMALKSQALSLFFERSPVGPATLPAGPQTRPAGDPGDALAIGAPPTHPSTRPAGDKRGPQTELRTVLATDSVHCQLSDASGKKQTIDCDALELRTAHADDGKLFARQVDANGAVHAYDGEQDLRAGSIALTLRPAKPAAPDGAKGPATRPADERTAVAKASARPSTAPATQPADSSLAAGELETMTARENVQVTGKDGAVATGDELVITTENGEPHVRLSSAANARVIDAKKNAIAGPVITAEPKKQLAHVIGAGTMHVLREQEPGKKPEPMDVVWTDRADMDGAANRIDVLGSVQVDMTDSDGALNHATGDHIRIDLKPKPPAATQPATRPTGRVAATQPARLQKPGDKTIASVGPAATRPATQPAKSGAIADSMQMDLMKDKDVKSITLDGKATVASTVSGKDGSIVRRFSLHGPTIIYSLVDAAGQPGRSMLVPAAGQMLVQDHRAAQPATKPKPGQPVANKNANEGQMDTGRGDTAFQWSKQLLYSESLHNAVMTGDVVIVHQNLEGKEDPVRMNADTVTAWFEPAPQTKPAVAVAPAGQPAALQLKKLTAEGHIIVSRGGSQLSASRIDFDPVTHWMAASGSKDRPAVFQDPGTGKTLSGKQLWWNTQTWDVKLKEPAMVNPH